MLINPENASLRDQIKALQESTQRLEMEKNMLSYLLGIMVHRVGNSTVISQDEMKQVEAMRLNLRQNDTQDFLLEMQFNH